MSKRNLEYEDFSDAKKQKMNENDDYNNTSPLLFFDDNYLTNENNNIPDIFTDVSCKKTFNNVNNEINLNVFENKVNEVEFSNYLDPKEDNNIINGNYEAKINSESLVDTKTILESEPAPGNPVEMDVNLEAVELYSETINNNDSPEVKNNDNLEIDNHADSLVITNIETIQTMNENPSEDELFNGNDGVDLTEKIELSVHLENNVSEIDITTKDTQVNNEQVKEDVPDLSSHEIESKNEVADQSVEVINNDSMVKTSKKKSLVEIENKPSYKLRSSSTKLDIPNEKPKESKLKSTPIKDRKTPIKEKKTKANKSFVEEKDIASGDTLENRIKRRTSVRLEARAKMDKENTKIVPAKKKSDKENNPFDELIKEFSYYDPGTWAKSISEDTKIKIIRKGPIQVEKINFPRDERNRCFSSINYLTKNSLGERIRRFWLVYSIQQDAAYCFPCRLFGYDSQTTLANSGSRNWKKLHERLVNHEDTEKHNDCMEQWAQFSLDNDDSNCGLSLTKKEAVKLAGQLKHFSSTKDNKIYLLAKQLESELQGLIHEEMELE